MKRALKAYGEFLRLVRRLPEDSRPYYANYARENFVNYREVDSNDPNAFQELFNRTYKHSLWVLNKYSVDEAVADNSSYLHLPGSYDRPLVSPLGV